MKEYFIGFIKRNIKALTYILLIFLIVLFSFACYGKNNENKEEIDFSRYNYSPFNITQEIKFKQNDSLTKQIVGYYIYDNQKAEDGECTFNIIYDDYSIKPVFRGNDDFLSPTYYNYPNIKIMDNTIYLFNKGINIDDSFDYKYIKNDETGYLEHDSIRESTPYIYKLDTLSGKFSSISIKTPPNKFILDLFISPNNDLKLVEEVNTTRISSLDSFISSIFTRWQTTSGQIGGENAGMPIAGVSPLEFEGYFDKKTKLYYFPALDGLYSYNTLTKEINKVHTDNYNEHEYIKITKHNDNFIIFQYKVNEKEDIEADTPYDTVLIIKKYDNSFKEIQKKSIDMKLENKNIIDGENSALLPYKNGRNCKVVDYKTLNIKTLKNRASGTKYFYNYTKKEFFTINTKNNNISPLRINK